ncbi:MAG TPA: hypothetical protein VKE74_19430 [Gemmataceae bacterium]|nr:hypothetical protein [Gemmataceae bacterium]
MKTRTGWHLLAVALILALSSCRGPDLVGASGRLTYKGKPVPSTYVIFQPKEEGKRASTGLTDDDGNFTLDFSRQEKGVLRGEHSVSLRYYISVEEELHKIPPKASKELKAVIEKYGDPKTSGLNYEITRDGQFIEINLE